MTKIKDNSLNKFLCSKCKEYKLNNEFTFYKDSIRNKIRRYSFCHNCKSLYQLEYRKRKEKKDTLYIILEERYYGSKARSKKLKLEYNIDLEFLIYL